MTFQTNRGTSVVTPNVILSTTLVGMTSRRNTPAKHADGRKIATTMKRQLQTKWEVQRETVSTSKEIEGVGGLDNKCAIVNHVKNFKNDYYNTLNTSTSCTTKTKTIMTYPDTAATGDFVPQTCPGTNIKHDQLKV